MVSLGTFMIAGGYLGVVNYSGYGSPSGSLSWIGYGIIVYAVAAIFVAITRFIKNS